MNTFWNTIAIYNSSTWLYQLLIIILGIITTTWLIRKPSQTSKQCMKIYLIFLNTWIALVYYYIYCSQRSYYIILSLFWFVMAITWIWDLSQKYISFERTYKYDKLAYLLLIMPFFYPLISLLRGLDFPRMTSPIMPCSVATFTIGLLLLFSKKVNIFIVLLLCHWSLIGLSKTYFFEIPEDFLLVSSTLPALYLFFKQYFLSELHSPTKPNAKYITWLLISVCILVSAILTSTLIMEFTFDA